MERIDHFDCDRCRTNHPADQHCEPSPHTPPLVRRILHGVEIPVTTTEVY